MFDRPIAAGALLAILGCTLWQSIGMTDSLPTQLVRTQRFTLGVPHQFTVVLDGMAVLFLRSRKGDDPLACLWALDLESGRERLLADPAELSALAGAGGGLAREEQPCGPGAGIESYGACPARGVAAFALAGGLWTVDMAGGMPRRLTTHQPVAGPLPNPTGRQIAYVSCGALRVVGADGTGDRLVAAPEGPDVEFGGGQHTGSFLPDSLRGYWWAPDGGRLLVARIDSSAVPVWYVADPADPGKPPRTVRYPAAGTANAEVTLWVAGPDGSRIRVSWDPHSAEYLVGAGWDAHGPYAAVQTRNQRTVRFLGIDAATGNTTVLYEQTDNCWVQLVPGLPARTASGALVGHADRDGTRHLTVAGAPVTPPGLQLRAVAGIDGEQVLFTASDEPIETHLWAYHPGQGIRRLSSGPAVHSGVSLGGTLVHVARGADRLGGRVTVRREGRPAASIASFAARPVLDVHATSLVLGPRALRAVLYLPSWHRPGNGRLPILADPYGGPAAQKVDAERDAWSLLSQWFAEQGFAVLAADGSGTPGRGPAWEREVHGDVYGPVLADQVTAIQEAARLHPDLDLRRVGIRGWSFGGYLAAAAVLHRPDVFHAAVAGAGAYDQRLYHAHWRERFLGHPDEFPERYDACSLIPAAPNLHRPLMLIHGLTDDNVHPANTLRLSAALLAAGRPHDVLLLPGTGHGAIGAEGTENLLGHQVRFLQQHLHARHTAGKVQAGRWGLRDRGAQRRMASQDAGRA